MNIKGMNHKVSLVRNQNIKENKLLLQEFNLDKNEKFELETVVQTSNIIDNFRDKFPTKYRTKDCNEREKDRGHEDAVGTL